MRARTTDVVRSDYVVIEPFKIRPFNVHNLFGIILLRHFIIECAMWLAIDRFSKSCDSIFWAFLSFWISA